MALYTVNNGSAVSGADVNQFTNLLNGTTTNTQLTVANRIRAQLTGAATGSGGYVGETPSLTAPTTGTFVAGDFASDGNGLIWVCKAGGSPGTWSALPTQFSTTTLGTTTASVTFSSIPAFTHLTLVWHARGDQAATTVNLQIQLNGITTSTYITERAEANTNTVAGANATAASSLQIGAIPGSTATALYFGAGSMECPGWNDTTNYTPVVGMGVSFPGGAAGFAGVYGGIVPTAGTNSSIKIFPATGNFVAGSRFSIYGRM